MKHSDANEGEKETILPASPVEQSTGADDEYERAMKRAMARMEEGLHLGGTHTMDRDALHDRKALRPPDPH
jgi:hypothetical protein